ncbi:hypothetical protein PC116_g17766 [Phytophthora cactorum]|nr:hypothetical protein PC116_g17766 [Phytophthora cactorum]
MHQRPYPVRARRSGLLTKLPPLLFPDRDSLLAVSLEPFNRLPRVLRVGVSPPLHQELALSIKALLADDPLHVVVGLSITVEERWRSPRSTSSTRIFLRGAPLGRVHRLRL